MEMRDGSITAGSFPFAGTLNHAGSPLDVTGTLEWGAAPSSDGRRRRIAVEVRTHRIDGSIHPFDRNPPVSGAEAVADRELVRRLAVSDSGAQDDLIRIAGLNERGLDVRFDHDGTEAQVFGSFPFVGRWDFPDADDETSNFLDHDLIPEWENAERVTGAMLWSTERAGADSTRIIFVAPERINCPITGGRPAAAGYVLAHQDILVPLADDDWIAQTRLIKMIPWHKRGLNIHAIPKCDREMIRRRHRPWRQ